MARLWLFRKGSYVLLAQKDSGTAKTRVSNYGRPLKQSMRDSSMRSDVGNKSFAWFLVNTFWPPNESRTFVVMDHIVTCTPSRVGRRTVVCTEECVRYIWKSLGILELIQILFIKNKT